MRRPREDSVQPAEPGTRKRPSRVAAVAVAVAAAAGWAGYRMGYLGSGGRDVADRAPAAPREVLPARGAAAPAIPPQTVNAAQTEGAGGPGAAPAAPIQAVVLRVAGQTVSLPGAQVAEVTRERLGRAVRLAGTVVADEKRARQVRSKVAGTVLKLEVDVRGQFVREGQSLISISTPDAAEAQEDVFRAREAAAALEKSPSPEARRLGRELLASTHRRLAAFDVPEDTVSDRGATANRRPLPQTVTIRAPVRGYALGSEVAEGREIQPGAELFRIADLSRIWVEAELTGFGASALKAGQPATLEPATTEGTRLRGKVSSISPPADGQPRRWTVRFEFPNPNLAWRPGASADVTVDLRPAQVVAVPDSAVIDTGEHPMAFVEAAQGSYEARELAIGVRGAGTLQVLSGVRLGERILLDAGALLKAEPRLEAALRAIPTAAQGEAGPPGGSP